MNLSLIAIVLVGLVAALCGLVVANLKAQQRDVQAAWNRLDGLRRRGMEAVPAFVAAVSQDEAAAPFPCGPAGPRTSPSNLDNWQVFSSYMGCVVR